MFEKIVYARWQYIAEENFHVLEDSKVFEDPLFN